jgi:hypothetical protein
MDYLGNTTSGFIEKLGKSYFLAGYLPAVTYTLIHYTILLPIWFGSAFDGFDIQLVQPIGVQAFFSPLIVLLLVPLVVGILLLGLNSFIIRFYEGQFWILRSFILWPFQRYNQNLCKLKYGEIAGLKSKLRKVFQALNQTKITAAEQRQLQQQMDALALQIEAAYENLEAKDPEQHLPLRPSRVTPTQLGNIFAVIEEYPFDRYGIDAVLLWPRLRSLLDEAAPLQVERLSNQKIVLDMSLNLSLLSALTALETAVTWLLLSSANRTTLLALLLAGVLLSWLFYQAALLAARTFGYIVMSCFDFYRGLVLDRFGLMRPSDLLQEQVVWLKLAAFLRRGESFYWPKDGQDQNKSSHEKEAK